MEQIEGQTDVLMGRRVGVKDETMEMRGRSVQLNEVDGSSIDFTGSFAFELVVGNNKVNENHIEKHPYGRERFLVLEGLTQLYRMYKLENDLRDIKPPAG